MKDASEEAAICRAGRLNGVPLGHIVFVVSNSIESIPTIRGVISSKLQSIDMQRCESVKRPQCQSLIIVSLLLAVLASTLLAGQRGAVAEAQPVTKTIGIGVDGNRLTGKDITDLTKVLPEEKAPWLVVGEGPGAFGPGSVQSYRAYMQPIAATPDVRHGLAFEIARPTGVVSQGWTLTTDPGRQPVSFQYAQVAIDGRPFDQIVNEGDSNLPFRLDGPIDDAELVSLVRFVRTQAPGPIKGIMTKPPDGLSNNGPLRLAPGEVRVVLRTTLTEGVLLLLGKVEQRWEILARGILSN